MKQWLKELESWYWGMRVSYRCFVEGGVDFSKLPKNKIPTKKRGRKKVDERISEQLLKENNITVSRNGGNTKMIVDEERGVLDWEIVNLKSLVRNDELTELEKEDILKIEDKEGKRLFKEKFLLVAQKIKAEWAKGNGRSKIVENLKGIKGASDGNVGKCVSIFYKYQERESKKIESN